MSAAPEVLGYALEQKGRIAEAAECYRAALRARPRDGYTLARLGFCERLLGRPERALELLRQANDIRPAAATHNEIALALVDLGRSGDAIEALRRAVALEAGFVAAWRNLAKLLYVRHVEALAAGPDDASRREDLLRVLDRAVALDPGNAEFRHLRAGVAGERVERAEPQAVAAFFDRFADRYESRVVGELAYRAPEAAAAGLGRWIGARQGLRAVDLGCGTGLSGPLLRRAAARLVGVDLSARMLETARARGLYDELACEDIGAFLGRTPEGSIDVALALDVLGYVGALDRVFAAAGRALARGGALFFTVEDLPETPDDFRLEASGRYKHGRAYVAAAAGGAGLRLLEEQPFTIRVEAGHPVAARLFALEKP